MSVAQSPVSVVTSLDDARVGVYRNIRDADLRGRRHLCMVESELVVRRLLNSNWKIHSLFLSPQKYERLKPHLGKIDVPIFVADISLMSEITGFYIHRGVLAAVHRDCANSPIDINSFIEELDIKQSFSILLAEGITNIDNIGTLFRNAAGFGVDGIILNGTCCDPLYRKSIRVSMGHVFSIPWTISNDWQQDLRMLKTKFNVQLIGCETNERAIPMWEVNPPKRFGFIMGEEKSGLSPTTMELCDVIAEIPMNTLVPSINVGVASAVGLYELLVRHRLNSR